MRTSGAGGHVISGEEIADDVVRRVVRRVLVRSEPPASSGLDEVIHETIYAEHARLARTELDARAGHDREFAAWLRRELAHARGARLGELVHTIVDRYAREISGHFDRRVYSVATRVLPGALGALLHGGSSGHGHHGSFFDVDDRLHVSGELAALRALARKGTVVLAPTHVSNLDSVVLGHVIHRLGLPPFAYGAGLNLFSSAIVGFFLKNLGAYTVDRSKTDPLYKETLKEYASVLLERGQHNLFFPGGTRSRSGAVESRLKKGLLGTAPAAFRHAAEAGRPFPRVFVVPCTLTYPLVLEASSLVEGHLRAEGGPHYVDLRDEFERPQRWIDFLRSLFALDLRIEVHIGQAVDPVGNEVDDSGDSRDPRGSLVDPARYMMVAGRFVEDDARDAEYTRAVAARLVAAYRRGTVALPTSLVAFVLFERLGRERPQPDLFRFLHGLGPEAAVSEDEVRRDLARALDDLARLDVGGEIQLAPEVRDLDAAGIIDNALATFATYHPTPVVQRRDHRLVVGDPNLLFYYRNRLDGFGLARAS